ncbi:hypothetical protein ID856_13320 [Xenorhabdus sp. 18]|uniref:hypothetical protein n=1 Tax=Xenorhabdus doucetiae TaxID=351671 RepID=UPI00199F257A|nr:hypothetical protein [Xenorhabdus sp. 18]MBD2797511.1 hypothetical protein [Xenorhabdus sp. 18]
MYKSHKNNTQTPSAVYSRKRNEVRIQMDNPNLNVPNNNSFSTQTPRGIYSNQRSEVRIQIDNPDFYPPNHNVFINRFLAGNSNNYPSIPMEPMTNIRSVDNKLIGYYKLMELMELMELMIKTIWII